MTLLEMTEELRAFQVEEPDEFSKVFPPEIALNVDVPGPANDHFDLAVKQNKANAQRQELADTRLATKWVRDQMEGRGAAKLARAGGGAQDPPTRAAAATADAPSPIRRSAGYERAGGDESWKELRSFPDNLEHPRIHAGDMINMMSAGVFRKGLNQLKAISADTAGRGPCLNFLCHCGCGNARCL